MVKPRKEFLDLLAAAAENAKFMAGILSQRGLTVRPLPHSIAPNVEDRWKHVDGGDLEVTDADGAKARIEVKHWPDVHFRSVERVPYDYIIVDEAYKIEKPHPLPLRAYYILNAARTGCLYIPADTREHWFKRHTTDGRENARREYYFCPKEYAVYETLVETESWRPQRLKPTRAIGLAEGALCGSYACGGCYDVADGKQFHPPRPGYRQADLMELDGDEL